MPIGKKVARRDGWSNLVTLLGTSADKRTASEINWNHHGPEFYEQLYAGGGIPARIVDLIPDESLRQGIEFLDVSKDEAEEMLDRCENIDLRGGVGKTWKWGRAYGGAVLYIVTDTEDPSSPLQNGEKVIGLRDLSRWDLRIMTTDVESDFASPNFGNPRIYYLNVQMGSTFKGYPIHWTRVIRFDGQLVPRRTFIRNLYWHDSILNRLYNSIRNYETANDSAAACLMDFNVDVYSMKNLANMMSSGKEQLVKNRIEMINFSKSVINAVMIDQDQEQYENKSRSLQGVAELLVHQANRLVAETDIPHTKLLGESPEGSSATGNSTSQQWYNFIASEQENYLRPKLDLLFNIIFGRKIAFRFKALRTLDDVEKAAMRLQIAQADAIYLTNQVVDASEIAESRFGGDEYSMETKLDKEGRENGSLVPGDDLIESEDPDDPNGSGGPESTEKVIPEDKSDFPKEEKNSDPDQAKVTPRKDDEDEADNLVPLHMGATSAVAKVAKEEGGGEYGLRNEEHNEAGMIPKLEPVVGQVMSLPMQVSPIMKSPGVPNEPRRILATRGNGVTAQSGAEFGTDKGKVGDPIEGASLRRGDAFSEGKHPRANDGKFGSGGGDKPAPKKGSGAAPKQDPKDKPKPKEKPKAKGHGGNPDSKVLSAVNAALEKGKEASEHDSYDADLPQEQVKAEAKKAKIPGRAATIVVRKGDHILMGPTNEDGRWTLPGGVVEDNESAHQGGARELHEETGIKAERLKFLGSRLVENKPGVHTTVHMYEHNLKDDDKISSKNDPDKEVKKWHWIDTKQPLSQDVAGNLKHANNVALQHLGLLK